MTIEKENDIILPNDEAAASAASMEVEESVPSLRVKIVCPPPQASSSKKRSATTASASATTAAASSSAVPPPDANDDFYQTPSPKKIRRNSQKKKSSHKSNKVTASAVGRQMKSMVKDRTAVNVLESDSPALDAVLNMAQQILQASTDLHSKVKSRAEAVEDTIEDLLLEMKSLSDARDAEYKSYRKWKKKKTESPCSCMTAALMMPKSKNHSVVVTTDDGVAGGGDPEEQPAQEFLYDSTIELHTDKALLKIEASLERLAELASKIEKTSSQNELELMNSVAISPETLLSLSNLVDADSVSEYHHTTTSMTDSKTTSSIAPYDFNPAQVAKMELWYGKHPEPFTHELITMVQILQLEFIKEQNEKVLTLQNVRQWFDNRRRREVREHVKTAITRAVGAKSTTLADLQALKAKATDEKRREISRRTLRLRENVMPNAIQEELHRLEIQYGLKEEEKALSESKEDNDDDDGSSDEDQEEEEEEAKKIDIVKIASEVEIKIVFRQLDALSQKKVISASQEQELLNLVRLLRSLGISKEMVSEMSLLPIIEKLDASSKSLRSRTLKKSISALLEMLRTAPDAAALAASMVPDAEVEAGAASLDPSPSESSPTNAATPKAKRKSTHHRKHVLFTKDMLQVLEEWYEKDSRPNMERMTEVLKRINAPPLRDLEKHPEEFTVVQVRRWVYKRRGQDKVALKKLMSGNSTPVATTPKNVVPSNATTTTPIVNSVGPLSQDNTSSTLTENNTVVVPEGGVVAATVGHPPNNNVETAAAGHVPPQIQATPPSVVVPPTNSVTES